MAGILDQINSIVLVMMENRSFDHILGHLTVDNPALDVNGLRAPFDRYSNIYKGTPYPLYPRDHDTELEFDVPHEWDFVATQMAYNNINGNYGMNGFVSAYAQATGVAPNPQCEPMGYFPSKYLPMTDFLAQNFCPCDNWFCPIPTSTQPNRTMAFSGDTPIHQTKGQLIDIGGNDIFSWLKAHQVRWRVYHEGFSFFWLYNKLWPLLLDPDGNFRSYDLLYNDILNEPAGTAPQVTIIEPVYQDAPHLGRQPDDNHAPLAVSWGEDFLRRTYQAITANPDKWAHTLMILYYDEHGGFYDHVPPKTIPYTTTGGDAFSFTSTGPRIPAILISPFVKSGQASHLLFDHTSVLQLLAEKFGAAGEPWSPSVDARRKAGIQSLSAALSPAGTLIPPKETLAPIQATVTLGTQLSRPPAGPMAEAFANAGQQLLQQHPNEMKANYPELVRWSQEAVLPKNNP